MERHISLDDGTPAQTGTEHLYHDENTLPKVRDAIKKGVRDFIADRLLGRAKHDGFIDNVINELQNAGILFRERLPETEVSRDVSDSSSTGDVGS